jgi:hypothetical protein
MSSSTLQSIPDPLKLALESSGEEQSLSGPKTNSLTESNEAMHDLEDAKTHSSET